MTDVLVVCEGQTERDFVNRLLAPTLMLRGVALQGTLVGRPQRKRGGIRGWPIYEEELLRLARERTGRRVAVLVDFYAMPLSWPGREVAAAQPKAERGRFVEERLEAECREELRGRFLPCVELHEFESLLFVDPAATAATLEAVGGVPDLDKLRADLVQIRGAAGGSVEAINDDRATAPSKRIKALVPRYDKVAWGNAAAERAGLDALRQGCPWLRRWLGRLEALGS